MHLTQPMAPSKITSLVSQRPSSSWIIERILNPVDFRNNLAINTFWNYFR